MVGLLLLREHETASVKRSNPCIGEPARVTPNRECSLPWINAGSPARFRLRSAQYDYSYPIPRVHGRSMTGSAPQRPPISRGGDSVAALEDPRQMLLIREPTSERDVDKMCIGFA